MKRGGALVRNPHFRPWSDARPPGYADRVEFLPGRGIESQLAAVRGGRADVAVVAGAFGSAVSPARLAALAASAPGAGPQQPATDDGVDVPQREGASRSTTPASGAR